MRRPCIESVNGIVATPLHHLHSVERGIYAAEWYVQNSDAPSRAAEVGPKRITQDDPLSRGTVEVVSGWLKLNEVVEPVTGWRDASVKGGPGRTDEKSLDTPRLPNEATTDQ